MKLVNIEEMRRIEQAADASGHSYAAMMELAGHSVARIAMGLRLIEPEDRVLVLVGPGNNGGDGLVAARVLLEAGHDVSLYIWKRDIKGDENYRLLKRRRRGIAILWSDNDPDFAKLREELAQCELIIDALLGTGVTRPIEGRLADLLAVVAREIIVRRPQRAEGHQLPPGLPRFPLLEAIAWGRPRPKPPLEPQEPFDEAGGTDWEQDEIDDQPFTDEDWQDELPPPPWPPLPVLAVDCPSGLNCDTGALDPATLPATVTVTFAYPKWGHVQFPGAGACGLLTVADIGVPAELAAEVQVELVEPAIVRDWLPDRPIDAHKGTFGKAMIAAGSLNYTGAAMLSAAAAMRVGTGLVTLAIPAALHPALAGTLPEVTWLPIAGPGVHSAAGVPELLNALEGYRALLVGPGLTTKPDARAFIEMLFSKDGLPLADWCGRVVTDADALNILAGSPDWPARLPSNSILTPHPGEMARLTGLSTAEVNSARIATARHYAATWGHIVLLKGPHTVVAAPDGRSSVLPFATSVLATAGSGDVLAGAIVGLLAQGMPAFEAAVSAAYLHGYAGSLLAYAGAAGGTIARQIMEGLPEAVRLLFMGD